MPPRNPPLTHFLCIPLVTPSSRPQLARSLAAFGADVTSPSNFGVPAGAVRPVGTLHLTLGMMSFPRSAGGADGEEALARAVVLLRSCNLREILASVSRGAENLPARTGSSATVLAAAASPPPPPPPPSRKPGDDDDALTITLRGLNSMHPPARTSVLYAPPLDHDGRLQAFCEVLLQRFREAGLLADEGGRPLLLHATLLNTVYVRGGAQRRRGGGGNAGNRLTIDARGILDRYEDQVWMEGVRADKVAICRMGAKRVVVDGVEDEAYEVEAEVEI